MQVKLQRQVGIKFLKKFLNTSSCYKLKGAKL